MVSWSFTAVLIPSPRGLSPSGASPSDIPDVPYPVKRAGDTIVFISMFKVLVTP